MTLRESHDHAAGHLKSLDKWKGDEVCVLRDKKESIDLIISSPRQRTFEEPFRLVVQFRR